jgi:hypothetical protein
MFLRILIFLILTSFLTRAQTLDNCQVFKEGIFEMYFDTVKIELERNKDYQIERSIDGSSKYKITWTSECNYELQLLETTISELKSLIGIKYYVTIYPVTDKEYRYETHVPGIPFIDKGVVKKIN